MSITQSWKVRDDSFRRSRAGRADVRMCGCAAVQGGVRLRIVVYDWKITQPYQAVRQFTLFVGKPLKSERRPASWVSMD